jgi:hydrogenase maturation protease
VTTLVGGVGQLYQGDLDLGRVAAERLGAMDLGHGVVVEDLHYGAIAVTQRLEDLRPDALVLVGAATRGRAPGTVERRRVSPQPVEVERFRESVEQAGTGEVSIDLLVEVAAGFAALPARTVCIEVEPMRTDPATELSNEARIGLDGALELVRAEVRRVPLLELGDRLRELLGEGRIERTPVMLAMERLVAELDALDREGRWGSAFARRDELKLRIATGETPEGMTHLDWSQWWGAIEELDRLQALESA